MNRKIAGIRLSPFKIIILGFLALILVGTALLTLPVSKAGEGHATFMESLFTSVSSVCVTGLVVQDTYSYWSSFGHAVILCLIQIGGMGVVTAAVAFAMVSGKKIGLMQRSTLQEAISAHRVGGIVKLTGFILKTTFLIEMIGGILLAIVFSQDYGVLRGFWYGIFHSISAFCNAGFDLMGAEQAYSSLTGYSGNALVNIVVMLLIVIGGAGFLTWEDIKTNKFRLHAYRMQSKVILTMIGLLIAVPTVFFYFAEFSRPEWAHLSAGERILAAFFQAISPRTAGFNTVDLNSMSEVSQFSTIMLMLIGGAPGSTAGGMKTTTFAVLLFAVFAVFKRRENACCFGRRIDTDIVRDAAALMLLYVLLFLFGGLIISWIEGLPLIDCLFETASAIGTVGLTLGITPSLGNVSRLILIVLMFFGRVGGLTIIFAAASGPKPYTATLPKEKITVG